MNCAVMTGYLTSDPTSRTVKVNDKDVNVTNFTIAVHNTYGQKAVTEFVRVTAWRGLGDTCQKFLSKGRKAEVRGSVHLSTYINKYGQPGARMELMADKVEFSGPNPNGTAAEDEAEEELPFEEE